MSRPEMRRLGRKLMQLAVLVVCLLGVVFESGATRVTTSQLTAATAAKKDCVTACRRACETSSDPHL